ncbi:uncharacterized protein ASCRUDRAFT_78214 [Ascoidea rubescens DSM 1968]|uniref:MmgE/PrpD C-terminal domain-containing protein n=1 Tax=Ascoidea rubescens DSM 1968 TaxID=1344418 RepID=A0A1D2V8U8_9ASCO|nr:hypothetical protein ASCRUDRAFT_78214 [Ascoidea rubescens DSM 1968]ODV58106.1 hypothetical protein ASCRUDRAFT_78214 [Ascoidea rubescens DSM 1968]
MVCVENKQYTVEYHEPTKRYIGNAIQITLNDNTVLDEVEIHYPIGHRKRREEGKPVLLAKFERHVKEHFKDDEARAQKIISASYDPNFDEMDVDDYAALYSTA